MTSLEAEEEDVFAIFGQFQAQVDQIEEKEVLPFQNNFIDSTTDDSDLFEPTLSKDEVEFLSLLDFHKAWHQAPKNQPTGAQPVIVVSQEEEKKQAPKVKEATPVIDETMKKLL